MKQVMSEWTFNGVKLSSFGPVTLLDSYLDMPAKRGDNVLVPMQHGKLWVPKFFDSRVVSFGLQVTAETIGDLELKMDALKTLLGTRAQAALINQFCDGPRTANAEVLNQLSVTRDTDPLVIDMVVDFLLADPFFRASTIVHFTATMDANPYTFTLHNPGSAEERKAVITFNTSPFDGPILTNTTNSDVLEFADSRPGGAGIFVRMDCGAFTAVDDSTANVIGKIVHSGDSSFMTLVPGDNVFTIEDATHTNLFTVDFDFYPPYL